MDCLGPRVPSLRLGGGQSLEHQARLVVPVQLRVDEGEHCPEERQLRRFRVPGHGPREGALELIQTPLFEADLEPLDSKIRASIGLAGRLAECEELE